MTSHGCKEPHLGIWPRPAPQHPAAATLHYRSSRFAWRLPGGQLHSPDEMRRLNVWDLSAQAAISTISYYIPPSFPAPLFLCSTLPSHRLPHSLLYIDEVVMGPLVRYSCCKNIVLFLVSLRGQCTLLELLGRISALLMMQFQCNSDLLKSQHSTPPPFFFFCRELIDAAVCYPAALQQSGACTSWGSWVAVTCFSSSLKQGQRSPHSPCLTSLAVPLEKNLTVPNDGHINYRLINLSKNSIGLFIEA